MPSCKNCNYHFPNHVVINGKGRNLCKGKYCLKCSPFKLHNTRELGYQKAKDTIRICINCNKEYFFKKRSNSTTTTCASCRVNKRRFESKQKAIDYKGGKCVRCGYSRCNSSMDFHHLDPSQKDFTIGGNHCLSWERLKVELDKCILLCKNCHGEEHELKRNMVG